MSNVNQNLLNQALDPEIIIENVGQRQKKYRLLSVFFLWAAECKK